MLPRSQRLPASKIASIMRSGIRVTGGGITFIYRNNSTQETKNGKQSAFGDNGITPRFAFVVSTKVDKRAVIRNRVRRLLSQSTYHLLPAIRQKIDGVMIGSNKLVGLNQQEMQQRVTEIFKRTTMLR